MFSCCWLAIVCVGIPLALGCLCEASVQVNYKLLLTYTSHPFTTHSTSLLTHHSSHSLLTLTNTRILHPSHPSLLTHHLSPLPLTPHPSPLTPPLNSSPITPHPSPLTPPITPHPSPSPLTFYMDFPSSCNRAYRQIYMHALNSNLLKQSLQRIPHLRLSL